MKPIIALLFLLTTCPAASAQEGWSNKTLDSKQVKQVSSEPMRNTVYYRFVLANEVIYSKAIPKLNSDDVNLSLRGGDTYQLKNCATDKKLNTKICEVTVRTDSAQTSLNAQIGEMVKKMKTTKPVSSAEDKSCSKLMLSPTKSSSKPGAKSSSQPQAIDTSK
jgi:hypothetical protein